MKHSCDRFCPNDGELGPDGKPAVYIFTGKTEGQIVPLRGANGFGFDAIFLPDGFDQTYAEMGRNSEHKDSVRAKDIATADMLPDMTDR